VRVLNKRQKRLIDKWFETIRGTDFRAAGDPVANLMPLALLNKLEAINDHETIYQNINRYVMDKIMEQNFTKVKDY
jgi:hypothetical protein